MVLEPSVYLVYVYVCVMRLLLTDDKPALQLKELNLRQQCGRRSHPGTALLLPSDAVTRPACSSREEKNPVAYTPVPHAERRQQQEMDILSGLLNFSGLII